MQRDKTIYFEGALRLRTNSAELKGLYRGVAVADALRLGWDFRGSASRKA